MSRVHIHRIGTVLAACISSNNCLLSFFRCCCHAVSLAYTLVQSLFSRVSLFCVHGTLRIICASLHFCYKRLEL